MNRFSKVAISFGAAASSFGFVGGTAQAETLPIPSTCRVYEVGHEVSRGAEEALVAAGFLGIKADGIITTKTEQPAVLTAQETLQNVGALDESTKICGYAGDATRKAAEFVVNADGASETQISETAVPAEQDKITVEDCSRYDEYTDASIKAVQGALHTFQDGIFGDVSCEKLIDYQKAHDISPLGALGPKTADSLGVTLVTSASGDFDPIAECPKASSCDIIVDLALQKLFIKDSKGNIIWEISVQSGKKGKETRTGKGVIGPVEYGPNNNPERASKDYPEAILVNARGFGNGGQKIHGSYSFDANAVNKPEKGSAGCIRVSNKNSYYIAQMKTGTDIVVKGAKPGTTQKYFK